MHAADSQAASAPLPPGGSGRFRGPLPPASGLLPGRFRLGFRRVYNLVADLVPGVLSNPRMHDPPELITDDKFCLQVT